MNEKKENEEEEKVEKEEGINEQEDGGNNFVLSHNIRLAQQIRILCRTCIMMQASISSSVWRLSCATGVSNKGTKRLMWPRNRLLRQKYLLGFNEVFNFIESDRKERV